MKYLAKKCLWWLVPLLVIASIWIPVVQHYKSSSKYKVTTEDINASLTYPSKNDLNEIGTYDFINYGEPVLTTIIENNSVISVADELLQGSVNLPNLPFRNISTEFNADEIESGTLLQQLRLASFIFQKIQLLAYQQTANEKYFSAVHDYIFDWIDHEKTIFLPKGFIWNDHALAGQSVVLANFWNIYRNHPSFTQENAHSFLQYVVAVATRLADAKQFTYATNHGVMQNLALLHLGVSFSKISEIKRLSDIGSERVTEQFGFYINDEGVVLEHSAEYHQLGIELLGVAIRYFKLLNKPIPSDWLEKYNKANAFFSAMRLPNGSLPRWGDTAIFDNEQDPATLIFDESNNPISFNDNYQVVKPKAHNFFPASGVSIWWDGLDNWPNQESLSQTFFTWSYYPGHGHKHADELAYMLTASGVNWWTNVGYWPYDDSLGRNRMTSWVGSNAPHLIDEPYESERASVLHNFGQSREFSFIDVERLGRKAFSARRQLLHIKPNIWLSIDSYQGSKHKNARTVWTTDYENEVEAQSISNTYKIINTNNSKSMLVQFTESNPHANYKMFTGSKAPYLGWVQAHGDVHPASAFVINRPSNSQWSSTVSILETANSPKLSAKLVMDQWTSPEVWALTIPFEKGGLKVFRKDDTLLVLENNKQISLTLESPQNISQSVSKVKQAFSNLENEYTFSFRDLGEYRSRVTRWLIAVFVLQELFFLFLGLLCKACPTYIIPGLRIVNIVAWLALGGWLFNVYFT